MKAYRRECQIIIEIEEWALIHGAECNPDWNAKVTDRERFLNYVTEQLLVTDRAHQEDPIINELLDRIVGIAIEGNEGIEPA